MVYEKECVECGKLVDFGGRHEDPLPDDAMEFQDDIYCRECVEEFVEFGTRNVMERVNDIEEAIKDIEDELDLPRHIDEPE